MKRAVNPVGTLFQQVDGSHWKVHKKVLQNQFGECVQAAGLYKDDRTRNVTIHSLRHTFGSRLAIHGRPARRIQYFMGHSSITTTERYMHLSPNETFEDTRVLEGMTTKLATNWQQPISVSEAISS
jgi:site-specific recombinase XerD